MQYKRVLVNLPEKVLREIDEAAAGQKVNRSEVLREAAKLYLRQAKKKKDAEIGRGYAEMGQINLAYAEDCLDADNALLDWYEQKLSGE